MTLGTLTTKATPSGVHPPISPLPFGIAIALFILYEKKKAEERTSRFSTMEILTSF
jgi:hypothetical protein